nr:UDP-3-O-acyl-N-acetylglucosamine deacetylase [Pseudomonadota bacterium]
ITFVRTDQPAATAVVPALWDRVTETRLCTVIANEHGVSVSTVEHLMAALRGCGIDNAVVEIDGPEVPIMDGSSAPFVFLIECAGIVDQDAPRRTIRILKEVTVRDGDKIATLSPAAESIFSCEISFESKVIGRQIGLVHLGEGRFRSDVSRARTFGFLHEVEYLRSIGLARGGSLDNAIVIDGDTILNEGQLRYPDEFVRHKILDSIGDLYLAGAPILGRFHAFRPGHALNSQLLRALFADRSAWTDDSADSAAVLKPLPVAVAVG